MNDAERLPPIFLGLFRELVANQVPLGVRDYLDGLQALQLGFAQGDRRRLGDLAMTLWARSDEERRLIARYLALIPAPPAELGTTIDDDLAAVDARFGTDRSGSTPAGQTGARTGLSSEGRDERIVQPQPTPESQPRARDSFAGTRETNGLPLPRLAAELAIAEHYALNPQSIISSRSLTVIWRRYRRATRSGPRTELDIPASIHERCHRGLLQQPVLRPRRRNTARLLVLADVSASMDPWLPFLSVLEESLQFCRFASAELRYFVNLPHKKLYGTVELADPEAPEEVLRRHLGASLLLISDAGSARGYLNRRRAVQSEDFIARCAQLFRSIVWLNPMPCPRWAGTTAGLLAAHAPAAMLPLDGPHLLQAVDILRGNK
jgi:uncharacterized protein with von Willebrand factor type A (vWA) domain